MAVIQSTYLDVPVSGFAGMGANGELKNDISRTVEDAAGIGFGVPVYRGSGDNGCTATVPSSNATFLGFTLADTGNGILPGGTADKVARYDSISIRTTGAIYVNVTGAVADGAAVTVGRAGGAADGIGSTAADSTHIAATGWVFDETLAASGVGRIVKR